MPRKPRIRTVEEARELVRQGAKVWRDRNENRIILRMPDGTTYRLPYDDALYNELRELYEQVRAERAAAEAEEAPEPRAPPSRKRAPSDVELWTTFIQRRRPLIEQLVERISWFQSAVFEIGMNTVILTFLMTEAEDADRLEEVVRKLKDRDQFVGFVMNRLIAIYAASKGAEEIAKLRERIAELMAENAILSEMVDRLTPAVRSLRHRLAVALQCMDEASLRRFTREVVFQGVLAEAVAGSFPKAEGVREGE